MQVKGFVYVKPASAIDAEKVFVLPYSDGDADVWGICVGPIDAPYAAPVAIDVVAEAARLELAALNKRRDMAREECAKRLSAIDARIAALLPATSGASA